MIRDKVVRSSPQGLDAARSALKTVRIEQAAVSALMAALGEPPLREAFCQAVDRILTLPGRVIVTGIGKSGIIARKIAATLMSTGTPAAFLHPGDASHGDLGMITADDLVLAVSWSGQTTELADILAYCRYMDVPLIVTTSRRDSAAGNAADICLTMPTVTEACPYQLAPTSSTTIQTVLGDALAVALIEQRGFTMSDFRRFHPGGRLGLQLIAVDALMGTGEKVPAVDVDATLADAMVEMSCKRYGCTAIVGAAGELLGVLTDGDLRRSMLTGGPDDPIVAHMTPQPLSVPPRTLASEALRIMNESAVSVLFVVDGAGLQGIIHLHDVLRGDFT